MYVDLIAEALVEFFCHFGEEHLLYDIMEIALFDFCYLPFAANYTEMTVVRLLLMSPCYKIKFRP